MRTARVQVVGFGPAALGIPLAATRAGRADEFFDEGVVFIDRVGSEPALAERRFPWRIDSNSVGADFLESIPDGGPFSEVLRSAAAHKMRAKAKLPVPLNDVGALLNEVSRVVSARCREAPRSAVVLGRDVDAVRIGSDGSFTTYDREARPICRTPVLILATGGTERPGDESELAAFARKGIHASALLSGQTDEVAETIARGDPVVVVGSSHSAFSSALVILRTFGHRIARAGIEIWCRTVHVGYASPEAAALDGYSYQQEDVCPITSEVNRFSGLRWEAKELFQRIVRGEEPRVVLRRAERDALNRRLTDCASFVLAVGFHTRPPPFFDPAGAPLAVGMHGRHARVDEACRLELDGRGSVPGLFGIGLGYARSSGPRARRVGINFFHGIDAEAICNQILYRAAERRVNSVAG